MLHLNKDQTNEIVILTLTEMQTLTNPYYLFVFTQVTTKQSVSFIKSSLDDDESEYPERYNQFSINTSQLFGNMQAGEWHYVVYEQDNADNMAVAGLNALEYGKMLLHQPGGTAYTTYNLNTSYKAYNG